MIQIAISDYLTIINWTNVTLFATICPDCAKTFKSKKDGTEYSWFKNHVKHQLCTKKKSKRLDRLRDVKILQIFLNGYLKYFWNENWKMNLELLKEIALTPQQVPYLK